MSVKMVTDFPPFVSHPVRRAAVMAMNTRNGKPQVDIRCEDVYRGKQCRRPLGGIWITGYGTILLVNRLGNSYPRDVYKRILYDQEERERLWREAGFVEEEPLLIHLDGQWHDVPGAEDKGTVFCPRHGRWALDLESIQRLNPDELANFETIGSARKN